MAMYDRYAKDASENLFNSIWDDMCRMAEREQKAIFDRYGKRGYYCGECQAAFNQFCANKMSVGEALDFVRLYGAYSGQILATN